MVGILVSFWDGLFSGATLVLGSVDFFANLTPLQNHHTDSLQMPPKNLMKVVLLEKNITRHGSFTH